MRADGIPTLTYPPADPGVDVSHQRFMEACVKAHAAVEQATEAQVAMLRAAADLTLIEGGR